MSGYGEPRPSPSAVWDSAEGCWRGPGWEAWLAELQAAADGVEWPGEAPGQPIPDEELVPWWRWQAGERPASWTADDERHWRGEGTRADPACEVCGERVHPDFQPLDHVAYANGWLASACATCWLRWPAEHRWRADDPSRWPEPEPLLSDAEFRALARLSVPELVALLRGTAPAFVGTEPGAAQ